MKRELKIVLLVTMLASAGAAHAGNLQELPVNQPAFSELTEEPSEAVADSGMIDPSSNPNDLNENTLNDLNKAVINNAEARGEFGDKAPLANVDPLLETPIRRTPFVKKVALKPVEKRFALSDSDDALTEKIAKEISEDNISIGDMNFKRIGGTKIFGFEQIKKIVLKTQFTIESVNVDKDSEEFTAIVKPQVGTYEIEISGRYTASVKIPLLAKSIGKGSVITQQDIELKNYPKNKLNDDSIINVSELIGKSATRMLPKGTSVSKNDIKNAVTIKRNSTVSAIYRNNNLEVKALAIAQDDGSPGDVINLKNYDSGKLFKAVVQADGTVEVGISSNALSLNYGPQPIN